MLSKKKKYFYFCLNKCLHFDVDGSYNVTMDCKSFEMICFFKLNFEILKYFKRNFEENGKYFFQIISNLVVKMLSFLNSYLLHKYRKHEYNFLLLFYLITHASLYLITHEMQNTFYKTNHTFLRHFSQNIYWNTNITTEILKL